MNRKVLNSLTRITFGVLVNVTLFLKAVGFSLPKDYMSVKNSVINTTSLTDIQKPAIIVSDPLNDILKLLLLLLNNSLTEVNQTLVLLNQTVFQSLNYNHELTHHLFLRLTPLCLWILTSLALLFLTSLLLLLIHRQWLTTRQWTPPTWLTRARPSEESLVP
uniref:Uncharacterized protein n=1 Tax=Cacopsylla melanoneura TaxID=428564 RepID=A0A8D8TM73_9HEMI